MKTYTVVITRDEEDCYCASVPALVGCHTWGHDVREALDMAREAAELYLETLHDDGECSPPDVASIEVDVTATREALVCKLEVAEPEAVVA